MLGALNLPDAPSTTENDSRSEKTKSAKKKVTLFFESKGRSGKPATILGDFEEVGPDEIEELASVLKKKLATGGSCRGGEILIQGDRREQLRKILAQMEYIVKG